MNPQRDYNSIKILENSTYIVNNSFHCGLHPRKVSLNAHFYSLIHKKILRKAIIERKFQECFNRSQQSPDSYPRGFRGKTLSNFSIASFKRKSQKSRQGQTFQRSQSPYRVTDNEDFRQSGAGKRVWAGPQTFSCRPNMMCNLTLYRRGFRREEAKGNSLSLGILESGVKIKPGQKKSQRFSNIRIKTML